MTPVNDPSLYSVEEVIALLPVYESRDSIYRARSSGKLPRGVKLGRGIYFPRYQINAILRGEDWRIAKPPLMDASAPAQAEAAQGSNGVSSAGVGGADILKIIADHLAVHLADRVADQLEKRFSEGERHEHHS